MESNLSVEDNLIVHGIRHVCLITAGPAALALSGNVVEMWTLTPHPEPLNQNLHFKRFQVI